MKELILDYSKWRSGGSGYNRVGEGDTCLHNEQGFECCLGQFCLQLNKNLSVNEIRMKPMPDFLNKEVELLVVNYKSSIHSNYYESTSLSMKAARINDDQDTTPAEKISRLRELFRKEGYKIKVINRPKIK